MSKLIGTVFALFALTVIAFNVTAQEAKGKGRRPTNLGKVASVDSEKKSFVLQMREASKTVNTTDKTDFMKQKQCALADIKEKDVVMVMGEVSADQSSVDARQIQVLPEAVRAKAKGKGKGGARPGRGLMGVVTATGDNLTIRTRDDKSVTVKTTADTRVMMPDKGSFADVKVGTMVSVQGRVEGDVIEATRVTIVPLGRRGKAG